MIVSSPIETSTKYERSLSRMLAATNSYTFYKSKM